MSVGQLALGLNWVVEGNYAAKWKKFITNKAALVLCSIFIMHLIGLIYTYDFDYGMEDIKKKVPLLILPFMFCTTDTLNNKERNTVLGLFIGGVTFTTFHGLFRLLHHSFTDIHNIAPHVQAIRLALMIVLSVFLLAGYVFSHKWSFLSVVLLLWAAWLFVFLIIMESLTGIVVSLLLFTVLLVFYGIKSIRQKQVIRGASILMIIVGTFIGCTIYLSNFRAEYFPKPENINFSKLDKVSVKGFPYLNDSVKEMIENGHYVYTYISWNELEQGWEGKSKIPFDSLDKRGNPVRYTLARYLTSMGVRKDSSGFSKLTPHDIWAIENGIPNYNFMALSSMKFRLYQAMWEIDDYRRGGDISGHSIMQRFEFWKAAAGIIKQHPLIGVGTGNVKDAFAKQYVAMHSKLDPPFRLRSHNQYLEIGAGFGLAGLVWFFFSLVYPGMKLGKFKSYTYVIFFLIIFFSMFSEDTLETQAGVTFYALFNSFFLFLA